MEGHLKFIAKCPLLPRKITIIIILLNKEDKVVQKMQRILGAAKHNAIPK